VRKVNFETDDGNLENSFADDANLFDVKRKPPGFLEKDVHTKDLNLMIPCKLQDEKNMYAVADCGSMISCISPDEAGRLKLKIKPASGRLKMADKNVRVSRIGTVNVNLAIGSHRHDVELEVLDMGEPLLIGLDLFPVFGIRVEGIPVTFPGVEPRRDEMRLLADEIGSDDRVIWNESDRVHPNLLKKIMRECADVLRENENIPVRHFCTHPESVVSLDTGDAEPRYRRQYPVSRRFEKFIDKQVSEWLTGGVIERGRANSKWNSPLLAVPKRDEFNRFTLARACLDTRLVNNALEHDERAIPRIEELFARLEKFAVVSELDLQGAYGQFMIKPEDREKTTFTWRGKRYQFRGAPFGLRHLTSHFQNVMEVLFENEDFCIVYVDNLMVLSKNAADHPKHVKKAIEILNKWNLKLNIKKTHIGFTRLRMLGHVLSGESRAPDPDKIDDVFDCPKPETVKQLAAFLGLTNYLRDYIPLYSTLAAPLERARGRDMKAKVKWDNEMERSFRSFKNVLKSAPVLSMPKDGVHFLVMTDASRVGAGAALCQVIDGVTHYIRFASRSFNGTQRGYSATRRELLAIIFALKSFRSYLLGTRFDLWCDHRALSFMFTQKNLSDVLLNWLDVLLDFDFSITHKPGLLMTLPDRLSRLYPESVRHEASVRRLGLESDESAKIFPERELKKFVRERFSKECPEKERQQKLLEQFHVLGHFGADLLFKKIWHAGYFWPNMRRDCAAMVSKCTDCIRWNLGRIGFSPMKSVVARFPFDHVSVDLLSLNKTSPRGHNYILVLVDICTRFVILRSLKDKSALSVARSFWEIICDFGIPKVIQSDNGSEFVNEIVKGLCSLMGVDHRLVSPYNPRANGAAEAHVKVTLNCIRKMCRGNLSNFDLFLPAVQSAINTKPAGVHGNMPSELFFGRPVNSLRSYSDVEDNMMSESELEERVTVMMDLVFPSVFVNSQRKHALSAKRANEKRRAKANVFTDGSVVMIRDVVRGSKVEPYWVGPYRVLSRDRNGAYSLLDSTGRMLARKVPKTQMKFVAAPPEPELARAVVAVEGKVPERSYSVDKILKHRGSEGAREYLVRWEGCGSDQDSWEPERNFDDQQVIQRYWDSFK
jgi:hypothetical protein